MPGRRLWRGWRVVIRSNGMARGQQDRQPGQQPVVETPAG
jgi:hypothetical protein